MIADKHRLRQLLTNLLSNAAKFTAEGGAIGLDVQIEDERNCLTFTVWDTGIGVDDSDLHQLFHPFVQLDSSLSRRYEGTGLGLTIVLKLVALHGGSLSVESQKGCGSHFIVRLPHQAVLEEASPVAISPPPSPQLPFMLVLTTLERAGDLLVRNLRASDHHVEMMLQSTEGAPISTQPDLIIVNSDLPRSNLLQTLRNIRKSDLLGTAPIVVLTALHLPGDREAVLVAGASGYYIKPLSHQEFDQLLALCHRNVSDNPQTFVHGA